MRVYLVEDVHNAPGRIYAVFADAKTADKFIRFNNLEAEARVVPRTVFSEQPPRPPLYYGEYGAPSAPTYKENEDE